jgi:hypothetical protein
VPPVGDWGGRDGEKGKRSKRATAGRRGGCSGRFGGSLLLYGCNSLLAVVSVSFQPVAPWAELRGFGRCRLLLDWACKVGPFQAWMDCNCSLDHVKETILEHIFHVAYTHAYIIPRTILE